MIASQRQPVSISDNVHSTGCRDGPGNTAPLRQKSSLPSAVATSVSFSARLQSFFHCFYADS